MAADLSQLPAKLQAKLQVLQQKLDTDDLESALDRSPNIANYIADTGHDPQSKLLVENGGKYTELAGIN
jgi:hypothetical protein